MTAHHGYFAVFGWRFQSLSSGLSMHRLRILYHASYEMLHEVSPKVTPHFAGAAVIQNSKIKIITPPARRAWRSYKFASLDFSVFFFYSACRRRGGVLKCPRFCLFLFFFVFFRCRKLGCRSWAIPLYRIPIAI